MDISLIARSFQSHKQGMGNYAKILYKSISKKDDFNVKKISQDNSFFQRDSSFDYLFYDLVQIPFKLKKADVYHALTPLESFYLDSKKSVVTVLDLIPIKLYEKGYNDFQSKITMKIFQKAINKAVKAQKIIAISDEVAYDLNQYYGVDLEDVEVVRIPISNKFFPKNFSNDIFTVGTISHLNNRKRIDILVKSFLEADIEDSKLLIGGKGPELENLVKLANNDPRIEFLGFVGDNEMNDFYNSLDVFVFPTMMEGYGLPIVEAMACNKPVITLEDAQIPLDLKNKTYISSNLSKDLKDMNFNCNTQANLAFVKEHSPEIMANKMADIYKNLL